MIKFVRELVHGEPAMFVGIVGTALAAALGVVDTPPMWLVVATPVWIAVGAFYTRSKVTPL